eukprot:TRINITY_DN1225_c0_g1_i1.p1 TRINITY_DN1225_c0_g1~~TRINITY_DN1225_c0_g1_i1.p1  ORF type:complete len:372 (+),score=46.45 TRINITY_DN1225_c0_g1_i1:42-1157(+)
MFTDYFWSLETAEQAIGTEPYDPAIAHNTDLGFFIDRLILAKTQPEMFVLHIAITLLGIYIIFSIPPFTGLAFKLRCYCAGTIHFWSTREAKVGTTDCQPPAHLDAEGESELSEKEIIFIRHGESQWNEIFNRGKLLLLPRLLINIVVELMYLPFKHKSVFLDSCLGSTGKQQCIALEEALQTNPKLKEIISQQGLDSNSRPKSVIFTSNLRRCVETTLLGLNPRLKASKEKVYVYSCLQEAARNVDTLALTPATECPVVDAPNSELLDGTYNFGGKRWHERAIKRMTIFLRFAFAREEDRVIVVGHSLYFKKFFNHFLDADVKTGQGGLARTKKLSNCGVVRFKIQNGGTLVSTYRIVPESIELLHGDWV